MSCTYSEAKKNIPNRPEATSNSTTSATVSVLTRKMLSRISGAALRPSIATNAASSTNAAAISPIVRAEPQPKTGP